MPGKGRKVKKIVSVISLLFLCFILLSGCGAPQEETGKLQVVATLFPQYDFARVLCGDKAEVTLLLPPGTDSHSFEPTPQDMIRVSEADLFLYTGDIMEPWAAGLAGNVSGTVVDVSEGVALLDGGDIHSTSPHSHHEADTDPHIWTTPQNAVMMVKTICDALCTLDMDNAAFYKENAERYTEELMRLDAEIEDVVKSGKRQTIIFGGHFAMRYFTNRYSLGYETAFDACNGETEPSPAVLAHIIEEIRGEAIPAVYYEELSTPRTAAIIAEETGAQMLLLHSCHNLAPEENGETYLSLMRKNMENIKIGLN